MRFRILLVLAGVAVIGLASNAIAQTSSGTMGVTATVQGSISLTFATSGSGVTLTNSGTNAATLPFGNISAYGTIGSNITRSVTASDFTVSTPFMVVVQKYNSSSAGFSLTGQLASSDATNTWKVQGVTVTSASAATIYGTGSPAAGAYGSSGNSTTLALTVPSSASSGGISNTINFTATAN